MKTSRQAHTLVTYAAKGLRLSYGEKWRAMRNPELAADALMGRVALSVANVEQSGSTDHAALLDECWREIRRMADADE